MELLDHLGIPIRQEISLRNLVSWAKGLCCLAILLYLILVYQIIAIGCMGLSALVPETANSLRINFGHFFWDVALYLLRINNVQFRLIGDPLVSNPAIILSNHTSLADYFIIHYLARVSILGDSNPMASSTSEITLPVVNFFSWFLVWRVPTIKILLHMLKCDENWEIDQKSVDFVFSRLLKSKNSQWIVLFPEVNIWTREGAGLQRQLSEKYFLPQFTHLLYPRFSGFFNVITALADIKPQPYSNLYDITILYVREDSQQISFRPPTLLEFFSSKVPITVTVNVKIRSVNRVPQKRHKLERYLEHLWRNKDKLIAQLKVENDVEVINSSVKCINDVNDV